MTRKELDKNLQGLKPLLNSLPRVGGEIFVNDGKSVICVACGATGDRMMIEKHRKGCSFKEHWKAVELLRSIIDPPKDKVWYKLKKEK